MDQMEDASGVVKLISMKVVTCSGYSFHVYLARYFEVILAEILKIELLVNSVMKKIVL